MWIGAAAASGVAVLFLIALLLSSTEPLSGTNSVGAAAVVAVAKPAELACVRDLNVPTGSTRVSVSLGTRTPAAVTRLTAHLNVHGKRLRLNHIGPIGAFGYSDFQLVQPAESYFRGATLCIASSTTAINYGGASVQRLPGAPVTTVGGRALTTTDISVRYFRSSKTARHTLLELPNALRRATLFEPTIGVLLVVVALPLLGFIVYFVVRVAATVDQRTTRNLAALAACVAFAHAAVWSVLLHPLHGADESEHVAYAQHLAATNERADAGFSQRPSYSTSLMRLMQALHHNSTVLNTSSRPRWDRTYVSDYLAQAPDLPDSNGGGFTTGASGHSPLYYAIVGIPYRALLRSDANLPTALLSMRLLSALLASAIAALTVLTAAVLLANRRPLAWLAGCLVALQPVFGSVAGSVNNDTLVNLAAAGLVCALAIALRHEPTTPNAVVVGALLILLPVAKITGFALWITFVTGVVCIGLRHGARKSTRWVGVVTMTSVIVGSLWIYAFSPLLGGTRGSLVNQHPVTATASSPATQATSIALSTRVNYLIQTYLPVPTFGTDHWALEDPDPLRTWPAYTIYIDRGYGLFGWKSVRLSSFQLYGIALTLCVGWALAAYASFRRREHWREWLGGALILTTTVTSVALFVSYAFATNAVVADPGEQGRYIFTAISPLAIAFSTAVLAFRKKRNFIEGLMAAATSWLALLIWLSALRGWFM